MARPHRFCFFDFDGFVHSALNCGYADGVAVRDGGVDRQIFHQTVSAVFDQSAAAAKPAPLCAVVFYVLVGNHVRSLARAGYFARPGAKRAAFSHLLFYRRQFAKRSRRQICGVCADIFGDGQRHLDTC